MPDASVPRVLFVDSGAWIALFSRRDRRHVDADTAFRQAVAQRIPLFTTNLVVAEVHRFVLFRAGIRPAFRAVNAMTTAASLRIEFTTASHHERARRWLERFDDQVISYTDATSFAVMEEAGCRTALGFDHDFELAGFSLWRPEV